MRVLTFLSFAFLAFCAVNAQSHNLMIGQIMAYNDVIMYKSNEVKYGFPWIVRTSIIEFPGAGQSHRTYIRAIHIRDHYTDGTGGYPTISAGGVGQNFVKIKLKSQRGYGFNFTVTIYGVYNM